jgi:hypothetical protein
LEALLEKGFFNWFWTIFHINIVKVWFKSWLAPYSANNF